MTDDIKAADNDTETTITLTNGEWAQVMHAVILIANLKPGVPYAMPGLKATGRKLGEQCPNGSAPWFGLAGLE